MFNCVKTLHKNSLLVYNLIMLILVIGAAAVLAVDLVTKAVLTEGAGFLPGFISIQPVANSGAAFGIFQGAQVLLIVFTFVILAGGAFLYFGFRRGRESRLYNVACAFVLGGALGNLFDRIFFGEVRDMLRFDFLDFLSFPICNFADVALNVGIVLLVVYFLFVYKGKDAKNADSR